MSLNQRIETDYFIPKQPKYIEPKQNNYSLVIGLAVFLEAF